ncbi:hypothetical protein B296_00000451 [Ensete ventricosum]|uniref:Uncharacterized protein n=1 Tax=Ensete ventricosum TaxID=4639 RepID=A0A427ANX7_ENSVE|nr:hypothetical protein B296_00000451 [Ensete ventricosum]
MVEKDPIKVLRFDLYRPVREVRIGSIGNRYADRPLLGGTVEIGRWRLISTVGGRLREKEEEGEEDAGERGDASSPRAVTDNNVNKVIDEMLMFVRVLWFVYIPCTASLAFRGMANPLREWHHEDKQEKKNV